MLRKDREKQQHLFQTIDEITKKNRTDIIKIAAQDIDSTLSRSYFHWKR